MVGDIMKNMSIRKCFILLLVLIGITGGYIYVYNSGKLSEFYLEGIGYSKGSANYITDRNLAKSVNGYSDTLERAISNNLYKGVYLDDYLNISYVKRDNFNKEVNFFLDNGYSDEDINLFYRVGSSKDIEYLLSSNYNENFSRIMNCNYYISGYLERYINYANMHPENGLIDNVTFVNIGLDNDYYTNVMDVNNPNDILVYVNKYHKLDSGFVPEGLVSVSLSYGVKNQYMRSDSYEAFKVMADDAKKEGVNIFIGSCYRSYDYQNNLYNRYVLMDGFDKAETYSARAGYSEHQTGLAVDILNGTFSYIEDGEMEYSWLISNSYKYGFILRYPKDKEYITGYMYEPWHYRYVGKVYAKEIYDSGETFEQWMAKR